MPLELRRDLLLKQREEFWGVALGDEVCAVGLYSSHHGKVKNIPVIRIGNLAALCEEPVNTIRGPAEGYLIELRTFAGLSGSPVFVVAPPVQSKDGQLRYQPSEGLGNVPLGMLVGYHLVDSKTDQVLVPRTQMVAQADAANDAYTFDERNTGFGIVIPIERVLDMLENPDLQLQMKIRAEQWLKNTGAKG